MMRTGMSHTLIATRSSGAAGSLEAMGGGCAKIRAVRRLGPHSTMGYGNLLLSDEALALGHQEIAERLGHARQPPAADLDHVPEAHHREALHAHDHEASELDLELHRVRREESKAEARRHRLLDRLVARDLHIDARS